MKNKKAQQAVGMSFNTIFSLVLIIAFIIFAFVAIKFLFNIQERTQVAQFYENLQTEIDNARSSSITEKEFEIKLPKKITYVCFANMTKERTADKSITSQIMAYDEESNVYLVPSSNAQGNAMKQISNLDIEEITKNENPYCVESTSTLLIIKDAFSKLVIVK